MTFWTQSSPHIGERTRRWVSDGYLLGGIGKAFLGDFFAAFVMFAFEGKNTEFGDEALTISLRKTGLAA